jgi:hypothetical protein
MEEIVMGYLAAGRADPSPIHRSDAGSALAVVS